MLYLLIAGGLVLLISFICYYIVFFSPQGTQEDHYSLPVGEQYDKYREKMTGYIDDFLSLDCEIVEIVSREGLLLRGRYYHLNDSAPVDICFHGYRGTGVRDFCGGSRIMMKMGHNVLLVDQRAHGESQGHSIGFGITERYDCLSWVDYAICRFGEDREINLIGVSMGAATVLMAAGLDLPENVRHIIADCPYNAPADIIMKVGRDMKLPMSLVYPFIKLGALVFGHFNPESADCVRAVKDAKMPILLIHGEDDRFVPCEMSAVIQKANPRLIHRVTFPDAAHGISYIVDKERYEALVREFFNV